MRFLLMVLRRHLPGGIPVLLVAVTACGRRPSTESILPEAPKMNTIRLQSPAFADGGAIPKLYTCDGTDVSPPLEWSGVPDSARSVALVVEDPDAPRGTWTHWVLFDIPPDVVKLPEGLPTQDRVELGPDGKVATQGKNDFGRVGYGGPCPPGGTHHYVFRIYALDVQPSLGPGTTREQLLRSIESHVLAEGRLTGLYSRC
jgi:hypothetical protein